MIRDMKRAIGVFAILAIVTIAGALVESTKSPVPTAAGCPKGWTSWVAFEGMQAGPPAASLEEAVRREFGNHWFQPVPGAIEKATPVDAGDGTTRLRIETTRGFPVVISVRRSEGGWRSAGAAWCAPDQD